MPTHRAGRLIYTGPNEPDLRVVDVLATENDDPELHFTVLVVEATDALARTDHDADVEPSWGVRGQVANESIGILDPMFGVVAKQTRWSQSWLEL